MKKIVIIVVVLISVLALSAFIFINFGGIKSGDSHVITLTNDGFKPDKITIKKGDTITFKTTAGKPFWPASDLHPTHGIYPAFDPLEPVEPEKTWSFKFNKVGKWNFHDHLAPYFIGKITVDE